MKKIMSLAAALVLLTTTAMAQASFGIGYMNPTHPIEGGEMQGFYAGLDYNITLSGNLGLAPGVYYSWAQKKGEIISSVKFNEQYVSMPLNFNYGLDLAKDLTIRVYAGPTFSYGLSSTEKGEKTGGEVNNYSKYTNYKNFDILIGGGVAFDYAQQFRINLGYNYGIMDRNAAYKRSYLHMGIAYLF